jgi:hypothetical protein
VVWWTKGYPIPTKNTPPGNQPGVAVLGTYTTNANWKAVSATFSWTDATGGIPTGVVVDIKNNAQNTGGELGLNTNGVITAKFVTMTAGSYQGWFTVSYAPDPNPCNTPPTPVIGPISVFTVNQVVFRWQPRAAETL